MLHIQCYIRDGKDVRILSMGSRIKEARIQKGFTQEYLAKKIGVTKSAIANYENEISTPKIELLYKLFDVLQCDANYLYQDEMNSLADKDENMTLSLKEKTHIKKYRTLDEHGKKAVDCILNVEYERVESTRTPVIPISNVITLSEFEQPVSAGKGVYLGDGSQTITREVPNTEETRKADFILRVSGDSMEPKYSDGDRLLIKRQHDVNVGEEGIFVLNNEGFVKRREVDRLVSLNPEYEDILFHDEDSIECKGRVIGKIQIDQIKPVDHPVKPVNRDKRKETVTIGIAARDGSSTLELTQEQYERLMELAQKEDTHELPDGII